MLNTVYPSPRSRMASSITPCSSVTFCLLASIMAIMP